MWQRLIDEVVGSDLEKYALVCLDDIIVKTENFEQHLQVLAEIFGRLLASNCTLSKEKCQFGRDSPKYFGYVVNRQGLHVDPEKLQAILNLPIPTNIK